MQFLTVPFHHLFVHFSKLSNQLISTAKPLNATKLHSTRCNRIQLLFPNI